MILLDNLMAGLNGGGYWEEGGGVRTSSGRFNASLLVGGLVGVKASSEVSPGETSGSFHAPYVLATFVHIANISSVTDPIFTKFFLPYL